MDSEDLKTGRAAVRAYLIEPLNLLGLMRPKGTTIEAHKAQLSALQDRLAYLGRDNLIILKQAIEANPVGPNMDHWPAGVVILKWASEIQAPPNEEPPIVLSWLRSVEGPKAVDGGFVVELRGWLRRNKRPPGAYVCSQLQERAQTNRTRVQRIDYDMDRCEASEEDMAWRAGYQKAMAECLAIVNSTKEVAA